MLSEISELLQLYYIFLCLIKKSLNESSRYFNTEKGVIYQHVLLIPYK